MRDPGVGRPLEHPADDLALEARDVELALAGDDELGAVERGVEPGGLRDDLEAGLEPGTERGEPAGEPAGRAAALELGDVDARPLPVDPGELLEPAGQQARPAPPMAPFCGP